MFEIRAVVNPRRERDDDRIGRAEADGPQDLAQLGVDMDRGPWVRTAHRAPYWYNENVVMVNSTNTIAQTRCCRLPVHRQFTLLEDYFPAPRASVHLWDTARAWRRYDRT